MRTSLHYAAIVSLCGLHLKRCARDRARAEGLNYEQVLSIIHAELSGLHPDWTWPERVMIEGVLLSFAGHLCLQYRREHTAALAALLAHPDRNDAADAVLMNSDNRWCQGDLSAVELTL